MASVSLPGEIARGKVGADGAAVVESDARVDRQTSTDRHRVTGKCAGRDELASGRRRIAGHGLKRRPVAVDVSHASRDDPERVVAPLLGLPTHLQFVVGARHSRAVMGHRRLGCRPHQVVVAEAGWAAARHAVTRSNRFGVVMLPLAGSLCCESTNRPTRASQSVLLEGV